ncbi:MAG: HDOD domain-containing protein [Marinobacter sp.]|nr:HDOD domain-containing protein [Marinobacter sp.]
MAAARLEQYLRQKGISYEPVSHPRAPTLEQAVALAELPLAETVQCTLLIDTKGTVMLLHLLSSTPDLARVQQLTGRRLQPLVMAQADRLFDDCDPGCYPPVGNAYDISVIMDEAVEQLPSVVICSGAAGFLLRLDGRQFRLAQAGCRKGKIVATQASPFSAAGTPGLSLDEVAARLEKLYKLPPMPALALKVLKLTSDPEASAHDLGALIELDPSLAAQIMRYARSALFQYQGQVNTVQEAVTRVLGFDRVAHVAMGIAAVKAFTVPRKGMLGMDTFWRHSLYCAFTSQEIARQTGHDSGLAYLCGLLHNFGLLLVGHLFPEEFAELNRLREASPEVSLATLERQVFGSGQDDLLAVGHGVIGGILHRLWQLPEPVVRAAGLHQAAGQQSENADYVSIVRLANALLKQRGIGDEFDDESPAPWLAELALDDNKLELIQQALERAAVDLDQLAQAMAA